MKMQTIKLYHCESVQDLTEMIDDMTEHDIAYDTEKNQFLASELQEILHNSSYEPECLFGWWEIRTYNRI